MISHLAGFTTKTFSRKTDNELTATELSNLTEGHIGSLIGLVTRLYDSKACPDLIAESDRNILGGFYGMRDTGEFIFNDDLKLVERLFKNFDPLKLTCSKQMRQIQVMTKIVSQTLSLMDLAGFKV